MQSEHSGAPRASEVVLTSLLEANAVKDPSAAFVAFEDGSGWTRGEAWDQATRAANHLASLGVTRGHKVLLMAPNAPEWLTAWWGISLLGAVMVPVNTAMKGQLLLEVCEQSGAEWIVIDAQLRERVDAVDAPVACIDAGALSTSGPAAVFPQLEAWDLQSIIWTSGTTGPSKGSLTSYLQLYMVTDFLRGRGGLRSDDTLLIDLPLFHIAAQSAVVAAVSAGARIAIRSMPAMGRYWAVAKETGASVAFMLSTMTAFLMSAPPSADDRDHSLRLVFAAPLPGDPEQFIARFGLEALTTAYGSTEVSSAIVTSPAEPVVPGSPGRARPGVELRIVDEHDFPVPVGDVGELVVRTDQPWELSLGYLGRPDATVAAWRNGWFHTGDAFKVDDRGYYYFHDRLKDTIRRRGENISSFEVERELLRHPAVAEAACVGFRAEGGVDEEVKAFVVPVEGSEIDRLDLLSSVVERLPHFMVPRYFEIVASLPKTATGRVQKHLLRATGNTLATWDREAAGLRVTRDGLRRERETDKETQQ